MTVPIKPDPAEAETIHQPNRACKGIAGARRVAFPGHRRSLPDPISKNGSGSEPHRPFPLSARVTDIPEQYALRIPQLRPGCSRLRKSRNDTGRT